MKRFVWERIRLGRWLGQDVWHSDGTLRRVKGCFVWQLVYGAYGWDTLLFAENEAAKAVAVRGITDDSDKIKPSMLDYEREELLSALNGVQRALAVVG